MAKVKIVVANEGWFVQAPYAHIETLGIRYLDIPADKFEGSRPENFKRALVRQRYKERGLKYGDEFEYEDSDNRVVKRKKKAVGHTNYEYVYMRAALRCPENDIRWQMDATIKRNNSLESALADWVSQGHTADKMYSKKEGTKGTFTFVDQLNWYMKCGWIK